jgi:lipooligosaccharide transport system permease protein
VAFPGLHVLERALAVYRRTWRGTLFLTFLSPVLYLAAIGLGLGAFVDRQGTALEGVPYLVFLAPGMLAAQAMNTATFECTFPVVSGIVWQKTYHGMLATPLRVRDILAGHLMFVALRLVMVAAVFLAVMFLFGAARSPTALLALPAAVLTGLAFAALIVAFSATQRNDSGFSYLFRFGITPLFLFSGTFFPVDRLPDYLEPIAFATPLYHGVTLARDLSLGRAELLGTALNAGVLLAYFLAGTVLAGSLLRRRLVI